MVPLALAAWMEPHQCGLEKCLVFQRLPRSLGGDMRGNEPLVV